MVVVAVVAGGEVNTSLPKRSNKSLVDLTAGLEAEVAAVFAEGAGAAAAAAAEAGGADWKSSKSSAISISKTC